MNKLISLPDNETESARTRIVLAALSCLIIAIPFLLVDFPPITDLPQQSAQIRLFWDTLQDPINSPYKIQWLTPYSLSYLLIGLSWGVAGAANAGRLAMLIIGIFTVIMIHVTAARDNRSASAATIGSAFFLNHSIYWGFYSFAVGWPIFLLWHMLITRQESEEMDSTSVFALLGTALLLYLSHVLWFLVGLAWLVTYSILFGSSRKALLIKFLALTPLMIAVAIWYPMFAGSRMATPPLWAANPISRLAFFTMGDSVFGGIFGPAEPLFFGAALTWMLLGIIQYREDLKSRINFPMLAAGLILLLFVILLPDKYMNTIRFNQRWAPPMIVFFLLALPAPKLNPLLRKVTATCLLIAFCAGVSVMWKNFERIELAGLKQTLEALPEQPKTIGLSFLQRSEFIKGYPFIQIFAYSQMLKGGTLNFSFAEFSPCLVVYKTPFHPPWTSGLEWFPNNVKESDLQYFDHLILHGSEETHGETSGNPGFTPVTTEGAWRLYTIKQ